MNAEAREQLIEYIARLVDQYAAEKKWQAGNRTKPGQTYDMARAMAAEEIAAIIRAAK